jgi:hypothetical protein
MLSAESRAPDRVLTRLQWLLSRRHLFHEDGYSFWLHVGLAGRV